MALVNFVSMKLMKIKTKTHCEARKVSTTPCQLLDLLENERKNDWV